MTAITDVRPLRADETRLLQWLLDHGTPAAVDYKPQLPAVSVVSRCGCGCPTIDLAVGGRCASPSSPSTILADALGVSPEGVRVGLSVHARQGLIAELEVYPIDGFESALTLPRIEDVEVLPDS